MPMLALAGFKRVLSVIMYQDFMTPLTNMVLVIEIMSKINARPLKSNQSRPLPMNHETVQELKKRVRQRRCVP